ncbi:EAL domain-containing protein [Paenibacillus sinopodophylli]|uniref:EAL domain-containing protein n=1 Tax=Paenibacillus sinopodophylli TaxID=1837342 RepID=UPI001485FC4A|nr:EAL domain-containing protein [Paenibacillus sinopodophylli]
MSYYLRYQPIVDTAEQTVIGYESFVSGSRGESPAELFRRYANQLARFDTELMQLAIREALSLLETEQLLFLNVHPKTLLAGLQLPDKDKNRLVLEIMESTIYSARIKRQLQQLAMQGFTFAYDDFGKRNANLDRLISTSFRPSWMKLDKAFISAHASPHIPLIIRYTLELCELLGMQLIVEGVETKEQLELLQSCGVRYAQGYYLGLPQRTINGRQTSVELPLQHVK